MKRLLTAIINKNNFNIHNNKYGNKYIKIGDEKLWKIYIKK